MSGGSDVGSRVTDVGKLVGRVTARGDIPAEDLLLGMDESGRVVVRIKQLVQCARIVGEHAASKAMKEQGAAAELAREEASLGSTALAAARSELAEEARWRTQLQQDLADLKAELQGAQQEPAHMHSPGPLLQVEGDASMNETRDQVI